MTEKLIPTEVYELYEADGPGCVLFRTKEQAERSRCIFEETDVEIEKAVVNLTEKDIDLLNKNHAIYA